MRIAFVTHGFPPTSLGGVEQWASLLAHSLSQWETVGVFHRHPGLPPGKLVWERQYRVAVAGWGPTPSPPGLSGDWNHPGAVAAYEEFAASFRPDWVIFGHLSGLSAALPLLARKEGARVAIALHDYWVPCARGQLVDVRGDRCPGPSASRCSACLADQLLDPQEGRAARVVRLGGILAQRLPRLLQGAPPGWMPSPPPLHASPHPAVQKREQVLRDALLEADLLLSPSHHCARRHVSWGIPEARITLLSNPISDLPSGFVRKPRGSGPLRVGFFGQLLPTKGIEVLLDAVSRLPKGAATLEIHGPFTPFPLDPGFHRRVKRRIRQGEARWRGPYSPGDGMGLMGGVDVVVVPSIWEENAPLIIGEARRAGACVVASRVGGIPELVRDEVDGLLVPPGDPEALSQALLRLAQSPDLPLLLAARSSPPPPPPLVAQGMLALLRGVDTENAHGLRFDGQS